MVRQEVRWGAEQSLEGLRFSPLVGTRMANHQASGVLSRRSSGRLWGATEGSGQRFTAFACFVGPACTMARGGRAIHLGMVTEPRLPLVWRGRGPCWRQGAVAATLQQGFGQ